jgi:DNA polymerase III delta prime subunit
MEDNFTEKYEPKVIENLPLDADFISLLQKMIEINDMKIIITSDDDYIKNILMSVILKSFQVKDDELLFISQIKDQGVTNIRYELKIFCQMPSTRIGKKKILVLDDIQVFSDNIQKLIINNIDKWGKNINIITTANTIYSIDEALSSRMLPLTIPKINTNILKNYLCSICEKESIQINDEGIDYILKTNEHNIQRILNILQKCKLINKPIDIDILNKCCTLINFTDLEKYITICRNNEIKNGYLFLQSFIDNGYSVMDILNELYIFVKITELLEEQEKYEVFKIISNYIIKFITLHEEDLELLLLTNEICKIIKK